VWGFDVFVPTALAGGSAERRRRIMSIEDNKAVVGRWFMEFWGPDFNPGIIDELADPDIRFEYSLTRLAVAATKYAPSPQSSALRSPTSRPEERTTSSPKVTTSSASDRSGTTTRTGDTRAPPTKITSAGNR
jgi:hypothetical protein